MELSPCVTTVEIDHVNVINSASLDHALCLVVKQHLSKLNTSKHTGKLILLFLTTAQKIILLN